MEKVRKKNAEVRKREKDARILSMMIIKQLENLSGEKEQSVIEADGRLRLCELIWKGNEEKPSIEVYLFQQEYVINIFIFNLGMLL